MDIEATKLELIRLLLQTRKESILKKLLAVYEEEKVDWWNDLTEDEIEEIKTGLAQADRGEYTDHEKVMKRFDK